VTYSPAATGTGATNPAYLGAASAPGGPDPVTMQSSGSGTALATPVRNFINSTTSPVLRYRPVACCVKWVPTGPYSSRSGVVGLAYSAGAVSSNGASVSFSDAQALMQFYSTNGSMAHEVKWLPTIADERFTTNDVTVTGGGSIGVLLRGVDGIASSATAAIISGYLEVTTVWEWQPATGSGLVLAPKTPIGISSEQVLSRIQDLGGFLYGYGMSAMSGMAASVGGGFIRGAVETSARLLSRGVGYTGQRAPATIVY
jgi:hypothetical protein